ncbi:MAG: MC/SLC25 family protein [Gaiellaceae bacterium]
MVGIICYPIDSVRRRLMMQSGWMPHEQHRKKYRGAVHCFRKVFAEEGLRGFYLGLGPNMIRSLDGAVLLVGYDVFKGMICYF